MGHLLEPHFTWGIPHCSFTIPRAEMNNLSGKVETSCSAWVEWVGRSCLGPLHKASKCPGHHFHHSLTGKVVISKILVTLFAFLIHGASHRFSLTLCHFILCTFFWASGLISLGALPGGGPAFSHVSHSRASAHLWNTLGHLLQELWALWYSLEYL